MPGSQGMFGFSSVAPASAQESNDDRIQPTFDFALRVWWAYFWRVSAISLVIVFVLGFLLRAEEGSLISPRTFLWMVRILPYAISYLVAIFAIHYVLGKRFRHFRIALRPRAVASAAEPLPRTFRRTIRVWWTFCWRAVVYSLIVGLVTILPFGVLEGVLSEMGGVEAALGRLALRGLVAGAVGMYIFYSNILGEEFGDFQVCLVPPGTATFSGRAAAPADRAVAGPRSQ